MEILHKDSVITEKGRYKGKIVEEIINKNRKAIFAMIKKGIMFDDEVLEMAHIKKVEHPHTVTCEIERHSNKSHKKYEKDSAKLEDILKEINTLEHEGDNIPIEDEFNSEKTVGIEEAEDVAVEPNEID